MSPSLYYQLENHMLMGGLARASASFGQIGLTDEGEQIEFRTTTGEQTVSGNGERRDVELLIGAGESTPSGWPAAVPVRPRNWNTDVEPARYRLAFGDTLSGLAQTYLELPTRWREIWDEQPDTFRMSRSPDRLTAGEVIHMPDEARDNFLAWLALGEPADIRPGEVTPAQRRAAKRRSFLVPVAIGAGVLGVLGLGYVALR